MQSVERVAGVLLCFTRGEPELGVTDIAQRLDLPKSAVHRVLEALTKTGLTTKEQERGRYRLGPRATELSLATLGTVDVRALALPVMEELRDTTGETVTLSFLIGSMRVYVAQAESRQDVRMTVEVGRRAPLYAGASGRALLMTFTETELDQYLDEVELTPLTEHTVRDRDTLREVLAADRARGYADSRGERDAYAAAVAAPITGRGSRAFACFSVCGPHARLAEAARETCGPAVVAAAATVSEMLRGT
ncbi:Transcriptional regulator, IclR family [Actinokineospora spheciospongiae]|uniref:Glycerol operon regulatory protein n=1 Tax=Actinokineospora spheciospongiae TaxID=909613 RepID=W7IH58_9PSEU|nr:IclR family transcriptional regulator [Actinokineospora spheciospongiae]EWC59618.1 Transcriptional regulator, IclR family [Actinokineospora spheciospongiae]PWW67176.1 IclR family transcriptional regulator [Actinokineospora spheciospongiae]